MQLTWSLFIGFFVFMTFLHRNSVQGINRNAFNLCSGPSPHWPTHSLRLVPCVEPFHLRPPSNTLFLNPVLIQLISHSLYHMSTPSQWAMFYLSKQLIPLSVIPILKFSCTFSLPTPSHLAHIHPLCRHFLCMYSQLLCYIIDPCLLHMTELGV